MTLHDRIMAKKRDLGEAREEGEYFEALEYNQALNIASQLAKEADELMAEMAAALAPYAELEEMEGEGANVATRMLAKYNIYMERNNEQ